MRLALAGHPILPAGKMRAADAQSFAPSIRCQSERSFHYEASIKRSGRVARTICGLADVFVMYYDCDVWGSTMNFMSNRFQLEYWKDGQWYVGRLPHVPGVFSQGATLEELEENTRDAYLMMADVPEECATKEIAI